MARAPNVLQIVAVLDRTVQMRANRRKRPELSVGCAHEYPGPTSEFEDLGRIGLQLLHCCSNDVALLGFAQSGRNQELNDRIKDRQRRRTQACTEEEVNERTSRGHMASLWHVQFLFARRAVAWNSMRVLVGVERRRVDGGAGDSQIVTISQNDR